MSFVPTDIKRVVARISRTWTKLNEAEIEYYLEGKRQSLIRTLREKYNFSNDEQAEIALASIERLTNS